MKKINVKSSKNDNQRKKEHKNISAFKEKWKSFKLGEKILSIIMLGIVGIFILGIIFIIYIIIAAPSFDIEKLYTKEASIIYDAEGNEIARLGTENRERVTYDQLPEVFIDALIATEDSRFYQHNGVDMARFIKASIGQVMGNSSAGGASTLTMQVAKQRYTDTTATGFRGIARKFTDMYMSMFKIEKNYTKEQIIEFYVNIPDLGSGNYGIEQAAESYFGKTASELTLSEAALIAGLFQAPYAYSPYDHPDKAEARRNQVLNLMKRHGYITEEECELAKQISVKSMLSKESKRASINQGFIDTVIEEVKERTGKNPYLVSMKIYSTMVQSKQNVINDINNGITYTWPNETLQAGIAVTDVKTGALVAVGAGRNRKGELSYNYATMINRHPGSSAKPIFDYGPAIEYLNWSTGQTIVDDVYKYSYGGSIKNWDNSYKGIMTAKTALASSRNIPALQAFQAVDQDDIRKFVTDLGITPEYAKNDKTKYINESHSIGGFNGVNPVQMSAAYGAFARGGVYIEPYSFTKVEFLDTGETYVVTPEKRTVMSDATAYMINMILKYAVTSNNVTAGSKSGTDIASKTGTSTVDSSVKKTYGIKVGIIGDSWQMSYSPDYCCALWVGYDKITSTQYLTSSVGSKARKTITKLLTKGIQEPNSRWKKPASVVTATIEKETIPLQLASEYTPSNLKSTEYFKKGTVPSEVSTRFSQLSNPTNLKANYSIGQVNLSWTGIPTPDAIDTSYLTDYFNDGYKTFAKKYLNKRLKYNEENIGTNGYRVYVKVGNGAYTQLGFTTNTSYTYNGLIIAPTTFMIKSSYSKFTSNMSSGISITVDPLGNTNVNTEPSTNNNDNNKEENNNIFWIIELNGRSTMSVAEYYDLVSSGETLIFAKSSGKDITNKNNITTTCEDSKGNEIDCNSMDCKQYYKITHSYSYNDKTKSVSRKLTPGC